MSFFISIFAPMNKQKIRKWLKWALVIYVVGGFALYLLQDAILFHPMRLHRNEKFDFSIPHQDLSLPVNSTDTVNLVDFPATDAVKKGIVLYFHGNKRNISWYAKYMPNFTQHGYEVMMIDYPGFGKSTGKLTEKKLYEWALLLYKQAIRKYAADSIIIYGKSMGTGIAAQLASIRDCKRLILETPYYDFPSVVRHYLPIYPVGLMLHYEIPTWQYIQQVNAPVSIFHGTSDWVVSYGNSEKLLPLLKPKDQLITIKGGSHNDLYDYPEMTRGIDSLLKL